MTYRPFLDDPGHRRRLDGQRYVVLRAGGSVRTAYLQVQRRVRQELAGLDASYPAEPHVTLLGLAAGTDLETVRELVHAWAREVPPLRVEIERLGTFPPPFQTVIVQIRRTPRLFGALSGLRERARQHGLADLSQIDPEDWVFHLSVAYCPSLGAAAWADVSQSVRDLTPPPAQSVVSEAEIVAFDDGGERSAAVVPLTGAESPDGLSWNS